MSTTGTADLAAENELRATGLWFVVERLSRRYTATPRRIFSSDKHAEVAAARFGLYAVLKFGAGLSCPSIGRLTGRSEVTVQKALAKNGPRLRVELAELIEDVRKFREAA